MYSNYNSVITSNKNQANSKNYKKFYQNEQMKGGIKFTDLKMRSHFLDGNQISIELYKPRDKQGKLQLAQGEMKSKKYKSKLRGQSIPKRPKNTWNSSLEHSHHNISPSKKLDRKQSSAIQYSQNQQRLFNPQYSYSYHSSFKNSNENHDLNLGHFERHSDNLGLKQDTFEVHPDSFQNAKDFGMVPQKHHQLNSGQWGSESTSLYLQHHFNSVNRYHQQANINNSQSSLDSISERERHEFDFRNIRSLSGHSDKFDKLIINSLNSDYNPYDELDNKSMDISRIRKRSMPNFSANQFKNFQTAFNYGYDTEQVLCMGKPQSRSKVLDILRISRDIDRIEFIDTSILSQRLFQITELAKTKNPYSNQQGKISGNYYLN